MNDSTVFPTIIKLVWILENTRNKNEREKYFNLYYIVIKHLNCYKIHNQWETMSLSHATK